ncbi:plant UBX domain-containing protein 1-like [Olea europaea var. sylvestris]|uniref:plant UBX domain-containing protein 1-like n=1 Tax=Olea europaea var. sylvestris TaxID=158386 RepID=UPI000C1CE161|nr:plant UBX domain-containing protein 1-like [Olea europaea var. sylvestris]
MIIGSSPASKRGRFTTLHFMDPESVKVIQEKFAAAKEKYGRDIRVFETSRASANNSDVPSTEEPDDFYDFTAEDYFRLMSTKKEDKYLKTRKIREAEEATRRSKITKAVIRVRFPDNYTLEASFHALETIQSLVDLLMKVVAHPELPFYLYTTPPKKQIMEMSQDFYSAGFVPGAIVYFSYDVPKGDDGSAPSGPFLQEDVMSLLGLEFVEEQAGTSQQSQPETESVISSSSAAPEVKPAADKKKIKPKWLKM